MSIAGFAPATSGFRTAVPPDTYFIKDTNDSADMNSARHGQFQKMEKTPTPELNFSFPKKFFGRKIKVLKSVFLTDI